MKEMLLKSLERLQYGTLFLMILIGSIETAEENISFRMQSRSTLPSVRPLPTLERSWYNTFLPLILVRNAMAAEDKTLHSE